MSSNALPRPRAVWLGAIAMLMLVIGQLAALDAEVDIQRGGISKADGSTDSTGTASVALTNYDLTYVIRNTAGSGAANLNLGPVTIDTASVTNCTAVKLSDPAAIIAAGSLSTFSIRITPATAAAWSARFSLTTSDTSEPNYTITVTGTASSPTAEIDVRNSSGTSLADGSGVDSVAGSSKGVTVNRTYTILNIAPVGGATLTVSTPVVIQSASNCVAQVVSQPATFLAPGESTTVPISVVPGQGAWSAVVRVNNSDSDEGVYTFTVGGTAAGPEIAVNRGTTNILSGSTDTPAIVSVAGEQTSLGYTISNSGSGILNIVRYPDDASAGQIQLAAVRHWTTEGSSVTLTAKRELGHKGIVSVDWYVDSDSALTEYDLEIQSGTLTWADGDIADKTFTITTIQDTAAEGTEQFVVRLHNPQGGATIIAPFDAYVAIEDDDAPNGTPPGGLITYTNSGRKFFCSEAPSIRLIEVARTGANDTAPYCRLRVQLIDGSATLNADYSNYDGAAIMDAPEFDMAVVQWLGDVPGGYALVWAGDNDSNYDPVTALGDIATGGNDAAVYSNGVDYLVYIAGNGKAQIPVNILGDTAIEPTESFHLRITDQIVANIGTSTSSDHDYQDCTIFITDDDASAQTLSIISEEVNCTATVLAAPARTIDGSATSNLPIRIVPGTAGYWQFRVTIVNDDTDESSFSWLVTGNAGEDVPDIAVSFNGNAVPDATGVTAPGLVAGNPTTLTFSVANTGTEDLIVTTPPTLTALGNCAITYGTIGSNTVLPNTFTLMAVNVTPTAAGTWSALISLASNDPDENTYDILLSGVATTAPAPEFQWYRAGASLTPVATAATDARSDSAFIQGKAYTLEYRIANLGSANLTLNTGTDAITASSGVLATPTFSTPVSPVAANGQTPLVFSFTPNAAVWSFTYSIATNDVDEPTATITVSGTASAPAPDAAVYRGASLIPNGSDDAPTGVYTGLNTVLVYGISNEGSLPLNLTTPTVISNQLNCTVNIAAEVAGTIAAGAAGQLQLSVIPTAPGPYSFTVAIDSDDLDEDPVTWDVVAVAEDAPVARPEILVQRSGSEVNSLNPDVVGAITVGSPLQLTYAINNTGGSALTIGQPTISASLGCAVRIVSTPATSIAAATGSNLLLEVTPTAGGSPWSFTWSVTTNDSDENPTSITVVGTGIASPVASIVVTRNETAIADGGTDAFGAAYLGLSTSITYTVENAGLADLNLNPAASILSPSGCSVTIDSALPATLGTNQSGTLRLTVIPSAATWSFVLNIPNNDPDAGTNPYNFTVSGTATTAPSDIAVFDGSTNVANGTTLTINPSANTVSYSVSNVGLGNLNITGATAAITTGTATVNAPTFTVGGVATTVPFSLTPGQSAVMTVTATPTALASWAFDISLANNDPDEAPFVIHVNAPYQAQIAVSRTVPSAATITSDADTSVDLGTPGNDSADVITGTGVGLATTVTYRITNSGVNTLSGTGSVLAGATNCTVTVVDGLAASIAAGLHDDITLRITPGAGAATGGWYFCYQIASNAANTPTFNLTVASEDIASLAGEFQLYEGATAFATGDTRTILGTMAATSTDLVYTIGNVGLGGLTISSVPTVSGQLNCTAALVTAPSSSIAAGATSSLSVRVTPTAGGTWRFVVNVPNTDPDEASATFTVTGSAQPLSVTPGDLGLGGGSGGGCGAGSSMGLIAGFASLAFLVRGRRGRRDDGSKE